MAKKRYSIFIICDSCAPVRQFTVAPFVFKFALVAVLALVGVSGYMTYRYDKIRRDLVQHLDYKETVTSQRTEIVNQRHQIQNLSRKINDVGSRLTALNNFERKVRIIANIELPASETGNSGMGGSIPEDLESEIPVEKSHSSLMRVANEHIDQLDLAMDQKQGDFASLVKELEKRQNILAATPAIRPARGWVTSRFGYRKSPFTNRREFHKAFDVSAPKGTPVVAPANGVVSFAGPRGAYGKMLKIDHGHGISTVYGHLNKFLKKRGEHVKRGDLVAQIGNTGRSTGPHLHYEVRVNNIPVNPEKYILD